MPVMAESAYLPGFLECIKKQDYTDFELIACVNQPEAWKNMPEKEAIYFDNQKCLELLNNFKGLKISIIDKSSMGNGWDAKHQGVGWARKIPMDLAAISGYPDDIILSLDADSYYKPGFLSAVAECFNSDRNISGLAVPYYHELTDDESADRNMLRYEIYMRNYSLNMLRINNPYGYTAIGSGMACTIRTYQKIRGITPHQSGEDFYFMLKLSKSGPIQKWCSHKVYPAARFSDRVFFGTGPAMIKGRAGDWSSYPVYDYKLFDEVKESFECFKQLYYNDIDFPMRSHLNRAFKSDDWWLPLRKNARDEHSFYRACVEKVDALRILQFLKASQPISDTTDEQHLEEFIHRFYPEIADNHEVLLPFNFGTQSINDLNLLRNQLVMAEDSLLSLNYKKF